jgi:predicted PhzF superfamily epimerase YddE/YHI9
MQADVECEDFLENVVVDDPLVLQLITSHFELDETVFVEVNGDGTRITRAFTQDQDAQALLY